MLCCFLFISILVVRCQCLYACEPIADDTGNQGTVQEFTVSFGVSVADLQVGPEVLPNLQLKFRFQRSVLLEKMTAWRLDCGIICLQVLSPSQAPLSPRSISKSPRIFQPRVGNHVHPGNPSSVMSIVICKIVSDMFQMDSTKEC